MPSYIYFEIKLTVTLALVYVFYHLFLRRLTFYNGNRAYLLVSVLLAFVIPSIDVSAFTRGKVFSEVPGINAWALLAMYSGKQQPVPAAGGIQPWQWVLIVLIAGSLVMAGRLIIQLRALQKIKQRSVVSAENDLVIYHVNEPIVPFTFGKAVFINTRLHTKRSWRKLCCMNMCMSGKNIPSTFLRPNCFASSAGTIRLHG